MLGFRVCKSELCICHTVPLPVLEEIKRRIRAEGAWCMLSAHNLLSHCSKLRLEALFGLFRGGATKVRLLKLPGFPSGHHPPLPYRSAQQTLQASRDNKFA